MCGVYTLSMPVRDSTSIELPRALSGSKRLMAWPGVISTCTVCAPKPQVRIVATARPAALCLIVTAPWAKLYRDARSAPGLCCSRERRYGRFQQTAFQVEYAEYD